MSTISTAFDKIITKVSTELSSHARLTQPNKIEQNPERILALGYGVAFGGATEADLQLGCDYVLNRNINILISRKYFAHEFDIESKQVTEKALFEDEKLILDAFASDNNLDGTVVDFKFISDDGLEFVFTEKDQFMFISMNYELTYLEPVP